MSYKSDSALNQNQNIYANKTFSLLFNQTNSVNIANKKLKAPIGSKRRSTASMDGYWGLEIIRVAIFMLHMVTSGGYFSITVHPYHDI